MSDPQKFCSVRVGSSDALIRVRLARPLAAGESVTFRLSLQDLFRQDDLLPLAEAEIGAGGQEADLAIQSKAGGLALAYSLEGFARVSLRWSVAVNGVLDATAQLLLVGASHEFPRMKLSLSVPLPPPAPQPPPPILVWTLGRGRPDAAPL